MIGETPKGAPVRCKLGLHRGQERGGTMVFTCSSCGGTFWQPASKRRELEAIDRSANRMIDAGMTDAANRYARDAIRSVFGR